MSRLLACLLALMQLCSNYGSDPSLRTVLAMKTGILLRIHVIAKDDTSEMQALKLTVRDAVRQTYSDAPKDADVTMYEHARILLPALTESARRSARNAGFTEGVTVTLDRAYFDERTLDGFTFPAGDYPALIIRLGDAQGKNWWGILDPETALAFSSVSAASDQWDWHLSSLLSALMAMFSKAGDSFG